MSLVEPGTFCVPERTYLLSHSIGLLPSAARDRMADELFDVWSADPAAAWPRWLGAIDAFRHALAALLGHEASWYCPQANVSSGFTKLLHALPDDPRRRAIVMSRRAFPSLGFVAERSNLELRLIPDEVDVAGPEAWREWLTDDVAVALITHVHSNTGELVDVGPIVAAARARGVVSVVDVAQSVGVVPIDVAEWNADFVVGSCVKWLCGGPGAGFLWVAPEIAPRCQPIDVGWFSHADPFEFDIGSFRFADDARRFWGGTPSPAAPIVATVGLELLTEVGIDSVRDHNLALTERLIAGVDPTWLVSPIDGSRRGGTVVVDAGERTDRFESELTARRIDVDRRTTGLRISPHLYNGTDDIDAVLDVLR